MLKWFGFGNGVVSGMLQFFKNDVLKKKKILAQPVTFYALLGSVHQTHQVVFLIFDGPLTAIFDATKLPQFLVLPICNIVQTIIRTCRSLKGFGWYIDGPAPQTVAQHYFTIGPMYRVIRVVAFRGIKRQCTRMAVTANMGQSPNSVLMLGQRRLPLTGIEPVMGCDAGPKLNRYWVGRPTLCVPGTSYRLVHWLISGCHSTFSMVRSEKDTGTTCMLASTGDGGGRNMPTRWRYTCLLGSFNHYILDI